MKLSKRRAVLQTRLIFFKFLLLVFILVDALFLLIIWIEFGHLNLSNSFLKLRICRKAIERYFRIELQDSS